MRMLRQEMRHRASGSRRSIGSRLAPPPRPPKPWPLSIQGARSAPPVIGQIGHCILRSRLNGRLATQGGAEVLSASLAGQEAPPFFAA